jgi:hypothetical protein
MAASIESTGVWKYYPQAKSERITCDDKHRSTTVKKSHSIPGPKVEQRLRHGENRKQPVIDKSEPVRF